MMVAYQMGVPVAYMMVSWLSLANSTGVASVSRLVVADHVG